MRELYTKFAASTAVLVAAAALSGDTMPTRFEEAAHISTDTCRPYVTAELGSAATAAIYYDARLAKAADKATANDAKKRAEHIELDRLLTIDDFIE